MGFEKSRFYRAGKKISLTDRQYDKITDQIENAGLECRIEECWTGSVYIEVWSDNNNYSKKIRLSNHDEGLRGDETTHNAIGTKGEVMNYLNEWLPEIFTDYEKKIKAEQEFDNLPEEEKEKIREEQKIIREQKWAKRREQWDSEKLLQEQKEKKEKELLDKVTKLQSTPEYSEGVEKIIEKVMYKKMKMSKSGKNHKSLMDLTEEAREILRKFVLNLGSVKQSINQYELSKVN